MISFLEKLYQIFSLLALSVVGLLLALVLIQFKMREEVPQKEEAMLVCGNILLPNPDTPSPKLLSKLAKIYDEGKTLFDNSCQQCHSPGDDIVIGPGLKNILERRSIEWLIPWVQNSQKMITSGEPYAVKIYNEYNKTSMQSFALSDQEVKNIFFYIANRGGGEVVYIDSLNKVNTKEK